MNHSDLLEDLGDRIQAHASEDTRRWWERYLRGSARFRGVPMATVRSELHAWHRRHHLGDRPPAELAGLALALIRRPLTEDKLAGFLCFQEILIPLGDPAWSDLVPEFASLFADGHLADWNAVDWFCVKVLGPLVRRDGEACARALAAWRHAEGLWQRRAGAVAFVNLLGEPELFPGFFDEVEASCEALVGREERFAQTAAGWVLRELSVTDPDRVARFVRRNGARMSGEALDRATKKLPPDVRATLR